jgi:hypothetical protein
MSVTSQNPSGCTVVEKEQEAPGTMDRASVAAGSGDNEETLIAALHEKG